MPSCEWFLEERNRIADGLDIEKFIPVINEDESLDIHIKAKPERFIRVEPLGGGIVFARMRKGSDKWHGDWAYRREDVDEVLEDCMRRIMWN